MSGLGMTTGRAGLRIGFIEPHLRRYGGIRRALEFGNRLLTRGHDVTFYLPDNEVLNCTWMRCDAAIKTWTSGFNDDLDILIFNHEPHWHLLDRFVNARRRVFYALHYSKTYEKPGSWECLRTPVDIQLANSTWTADAIAAEIGVRPLVQLGGANRDIFRPYGGSKKYPILTTGGGDRPWKGTATVHEAGRLLGIPVEEYAPKDLSQPDLGREYDAAQVFVVGSWFEGFCQPGLEALACGVPLVTTDNGGCREYAIDGVTALVVPPRDPVAMANAIRRLLNDEVLAKQLVENGLALVDRRFDWERRTDELAGRLEEISVGTLSAPPPPRPAPPREPVLSVVVLAWDNLLYTQDFVETVRQNTDVPYELIIVDNGSEWEPANYARAAADVAVLNERNLGFAKGMNQGLRAARGKYVAFCNNDTRLPKGWASKLIETAADHPDAGIVVPALTAAGNDCTVRDAPGDAVVVLSPFSAPPSAVLYLMPTALTKELGEWGEEYEIASGEDVDLAFKVWVNGLDIVYDQRVLVAHVGKVSASKLDDWKALWAKNRALFLEKWSGKPAVPRIASCPPDTYERNCATAAAVADWMHKYFATRDKLTEKQKAPAPRKNPQPNPRPVPKASSGQIPTRPTASRKAARKIRRAMRERPHSVGVAVRVLLACSPSYVAHRAREALRRS
jgi:GT2 family glycosyltransferase